MAELSEALYKEIVDQGLAEFPNECCGVIAAEGGTPVKVFPMTNVDASPATYRLDPKEQLKIWDEIEVAGWDLWAIYHSHTHSEAYPSETDKRQAFYPESLYMVLSLRDRENPELRAFTIEDEISEEEVTIR
jgi:proteasome lid subunit RPN8/RPN11